jgi:hypothetical protein
MKSVKGFLKGLVAILVLIGIAVVVITNWSWVFSKRITGKVVDVERVQTSTIMGNRATDEQMFSYAVMIQGDDGKIYSSSSEDRKWQVVKKGYCVDALLYRYPPWELSQANTFFNARLKEVMVCPGETSLPTGDPAPAPATSPMPAPPQAPAATPPPTTGPVH